MYFSLVLTPATLTMAGLIMSYFHIQVGANYSSPVWTHQRSIDANWHQATVELTSTSTYNIVFEGIRGTSFLGDIALDDIRVSNGACGEISVVKGYSLSFGGGGGLGIFGFNIVS